MNQWLDKGSSLQRSTGRPTALHADSSLLGGHQIDSTDLGCPISKNKQTTTTKNKKIKNQKKLALPSSTCPNPV